MMPSPSSTYEIVLAESVGALELGILGFVDHPHATAQALPKPCSEKWSYQSSPDPFSKSAWPGLSEIIQQPMVSIVQRKNRSIQYQSEDKFAYRYKV
jgi:hypothetical protein